MASARGASPAQLECITHRIAVIQEEEHDRRGKGGSGAKGWRRLAHRAALPRAIGSGEAIEPPSHDSFGKVRMCRVAPFVVPLLLGACSLVTDVDGLATGAGDTDASMDAREPIDASSVEGSSLDAADAASTTCPMAVASFCDDFERADVRGAWDAVETPNAGTVVIEGSPGARRLRATTGAAPTGVTEPKALVTKSFPVSVTKVRVEATVSTEGSPQGAEYRMPWKLKLTDATGDIQLVYLVQDKNGTAVGLQDFATNPATLVFTRFERPAGAHRVVVTAAVGGQLQIFVDGAKVIDKPVPSWFRAGTATIDLGIASSPLPCTAFAVTIDDFVFAAD